jgi:hypothetical protein
MTWPDLLGSVTNLSRLIYPVAAPIRGKIPRTQGMGVAYRQKVITGISGSRTGTSGGAPVDIGLAEFQGGGTIAGNWPLNIPPAGTQDAVDITVPYRFSGLSESVSWLAQFAGQGFEDASGLANLILMQEMMLGEEAAMIGATSIALTTPSNPTVAARTANSGETALSGVTTNVFVKVAAATWYGETTVQASGASIAWSSGQVVDVTISPVAGALWYNIYTTTGASAGTYHLHASGVGGLHYTLQGAIPTSSAQPQASDSGTFSANRMEGIVSTLSGHSAGGGAIYPAGWQGGYINQSVGSTLNINAVNTGLQQLYDGSGAFRADPAEIIGEAGDLMRLSNDMVQAGAANNYRLTIDQSQVGAIRAGAAVSEYVNPATRSIVRLSVHPWFPQGTAVGMSYTLPSAMSRVSNVWEMNLVQDYISVGWPVIDATYRYSMFTYGAMACNAPQYNMILQGIQSSSRAGSTGTWS